MAKRIRVTRVLVYEGEEYWVEQTLLSNAVTEDKPLDFGKRGKIEQQPLRFEEVANG